MLINHVVSDIVVSIRSKRLGPGSLKVKRKVKRRGRERKLKDIKRKAKRRGEGNEGTERTKIVLQKSRYQI